MNNNCCNLIQWMTCKNVLDCVSVFLKAYKCHCLIAGNIHSKMRWTTPHLSWLTCRIAVHLIIYVFINNITVWNILISLFPTVLVKNLFSNTILILFLFLFFCILNIQCNNDDFFIKRPLSTNNDILKYRSMSRKVNFDKTSESVFQI